MFFKSIADICYGSQNSFENRKTGVIVIRLIFLVIAFALGSWVWGADWQTWIKVVVTFMLVVPFVSSAFT